MVSENPRFMALTNLGIAGVTRTTRPLRPLVSYALLSV